MRSNNPLKPFVEYTEGLEAANDQLAVQLSEANQEVNRLEQTAIAYEARIEALEAQLTGMIPTPPAWSATADKVIESGLYALDLRIPYVFDKEDRTGMDCSGFTQSIFGHVGIKLPRPSYLQAQFGAEVKGLANARRGDIIAFNRTSRNEDKPGGVDHVGVYIGNNKVLHTPNPEKGIHIADLTGDLLNDVVTIRRVITN